MDGPPCDFEVRRVVGVVRWGLRGAWVMLFQVVCAKPGCGASNSIASDRAGSPGACLACGAVLDDAVPAPDAYRTVCRLPGDSLDEIPAPTIPAREPEATETPTILTRPMDLPERFGRFRILRELGHGGMGSVYLAHDTELDRPVALKVPHGNFGSDRAMAERFRREARVAANFNHPNFCSIYDVNQVEGRHFLAMAYIDGETLCSKVNPVDPTPPRDASEIVLELARAMAEAHRLGIVHRDLKPANVMVDRRGRLIIMDFGIARRAGPEEVDLTRTGELIGTPHYMSPEQMLGDPHDIGPAADLYALGVIFYELLTGHRPFVGSASFVIGQVLHAEPPPPTKHRPGLDPVLEAICLKAMAKRPEGRHASMDALADDLERRLRPPAPKDRAATPGPRRTRNPLVAAVVALALVSLLGYLATDRGTLRLEGLARRMVVRIDGREASSDASGDTFSLRAGMHEVLVSEDDALLVSRKTFLVTRGRETLVPIRALGKPIEVVRAEAPPARSAKAEELARLSPSPIPPERRVESNTMVQPGPEPSPGELVDPGANGPGPVVRPGPNSQTEKTDPPLADQSPSEGQARPATRLASREAIVTDPLPPSMPTPAPPIEPKLAEPDPAPGDLTRGIASFAKRDYGGAIEFYDQAIQRDKANPRAFFLRGRAWAAKGRFDPAIADFSEAIRLDPNQAEAHAERGLASMAKGDRSGALGDIDLAFKLDRNSSAAHTARGVARYELDDPDRSIADLLRAIDLNPEDHRPHAKLAWILATHGRAEIRDGLKALDHAGLACRMTGLNDAEALASLAAAYAEVGKFGEAVRFQDEAIERADESMRRSYRDGLEMYSRGEPIRLIPASPEPRR